MNMIESKKMSELGKLLKKKKLFIFLAIFLELLTESFILPECQRKKSYVNSFSVAEPELNLMEFSNFTK